MSAPRDLCQKLGIEVPIFCGAMYPCSNPELVAAASEAGAMGVIQPLSLTFVYGYPFREGLRKIRSLTQKPLGLNILVEKSSRIYEKRMQEFVDVALEEGIRFFVTALGNPTWVIKKTEPFGGIVFHDVTERKWALRVKDLGVQGFICVNRQAGGHAGTCSPEELYESLSDLGLPLVCAGGVGSPVEFTQMLQMGYAGIQMGTRFIATQECQASEAYKKAIVDSHAEDIVLTEKITGIPLAVIQTEFVKKVGTRAGPLGRYLLRNPHTKHTMRLLYQLMSVIKFKKSIVKPLGPQHYYQAGKSVETIQSIQSTAQIVNDFAAVYSKAFS